MLRVSSGTAKNKKLITPNIPNFRAVQEVTKQALFSIIGDKVIDSECLDLFAGSGNLGLEALSREAKWCDFVDESREAKDAILENLRTCGFDDRADVMLSDVIKYVSNTTKRYDIVFVDPFYGETSHRHLMKNLAELLKENGIVAFTHGKELNINKIIEDTNLEIKTQRRFGTSYLTIMGKREPI